MLVSKTVEVKLSSSNIKHYEDLGYEIPRSKDKKGRMSTPKGTTILVKIEDLPKGSHVKVDVECDYCGKLYDKPYFKYISQNDENTIHKDSCEKCKGKKTKEYMIEIHNVEHNSQLEEVRKSVGSKNRENFDVVKKAFDEINYILLEDNYINKKTPMRFTCKEHEYLGVQTTTYAIVRTFSSGCKKCRYEKISGENYYNWKGGITLLSIYLRSKIESWKADSFTHYKGKCVITGLNSNTVLHHIYNFHKIVKETLNNLNLPIYEKVNKYSDDELKNIEDECLKLHYLYGYGIPIREDLHILFHSLYGNVDNNLKQVLEFEQRYLNGEFNNLLEEVV